MRAVLKVGSALAFPAQMLPVVWLGSGWAGAVDVSAGGCGYDGTCSDQGSVTLTGCFFLILVSAEGFAGFALALAAWRRLRRGRSTDGSKDSGIAADPDFLGLLAPRLAWAALAGCAAAWLLTIQAGVIDQQGVERYPRSDAAEGSFFITWNKRALEVEFLVAVLATAIVAGWRRRRSIR